MTTRRTRGVGSPSLARLADIERPPPAVPKPIYLHRCLACGLTNPTSRRECPKICEWCGEKLLTDELVVREEVRLGKRAYTEDYQRD